VARLAKDLPVFARRLRRAREELGLTQTELGLAAGLDPAVASTRVNQYEQGKHVPHLSTANLLAKVLGIPVALLYAEDEQLARLLQAWAKMTPSERKRLVKQAELKHSQVTTDLAE
jgi:transcriptional regulator with XRE-family HTH domain